VICSSRKPFTPPEHWLITSQIDLQSFVEAAVIEEQQISQNGEGIEFSSSGRTTASSRAMSKRQVAYLSPRLGVLNNIPFAIPFEVRVSIFRHFVANDMIRLGRVSRFSRRIRSRIVVRRDKIAQDGFDKLQEVDLKSSLEIVFIDQFGNEEYVPMVSTLVVMLMSILELESMGVVSSKNF
jgi:ubiquitin-protein ligase E3 C